jgi:hypothetical protein
MPNAFLISIASFVLKSLAAPEMKAYRRLCAFVLKKTGVKLPDNPKIEAEIVAVQAAIVPILIQALITGKFDLALGQKILATVEGVLGSV